MSPVDLAATVDFTNPVFLGAAGTAIAALLGSIVAVAKLRPDNARAIVAAATELADDQREWGRELKKETFDLRAQAVETDNQMRDLHADLVAARADLAQLRREHEAEMAEITRQRDAALALVESLRAQAAELRAEVARLRDELVQRHPTT